MKKRIISIALVLCMALTLLPTAAFAANTINPTESTLEGLRAAFASAQSGDTVQLTAGIESEAKMLQFITVNKAVTLDLGGHTINYHGVGGSVNSRSGLFYVASGGSLTIKGGAVTLDGNCSVLAQVAAGGKLTVENGTYESTAQEDGALLAGSGGTLEIKGGSLTATSYYAAVISGGTMNISGGSLTSKNSFALVSMGGKVTMTGGTLTGDQDVTAYLASGGSIDMTGGEIINTASGLALNLQAAQNASTIGGSAKVAAKDSYGVYTEAPLTISSDAVITSVSNVAVCSKNQLSITGGTVSSTSGMAVANIGDMTVTGGEVHSGSSHGLTSMAPAGKTVTISGGTITSDSSFAAVNYDAGTLSISGGSITTAGGACAVFNNAGGTVNVTGGTLSGKSTTIVNNSTGTVKVSAGTIAGIVNYNAGGKTVIDGGSVKTVQGTTPKNSAGADLRLYPVQITDAASTPIVDGDLTFTPSVRYSFSGVTTDSSTMVYLWLPDGLTSATYTKDETTLTGGVASAGNVTVLPNFTATVKFKLNGAAWTGYNTQVLLSTQAPASGVRIPTSPIYPTSSANGVYTFSGLVERETYYIWEKHILGFICKSDTLTLTSENPEKIVSYYQAFLHPGTGIETPEVEITALEGEDVSYSTNFIKAGYKFKNWVYTDGGKQYSADASLSIKGINAFYELTAMGEIDYYTATVTVQKDNKEWADHGKAIVLSPSSTQVDAEGAITDLTKVSPLVPTYYVWAGGEYTGQTITKNSKAATVDYYTVTVAKGDNITSVSGGTTVLKGGSATITATAAADKVFSRWQTADGTLYSTTVETNINNITAPVDLKAVGGVDKYTVTVTVNLDGGIWSTPHKLVLSSSSTQCGAISGTYNSTTGQYTFSTVSGVGNYYLWDADTVQLVSSTPVSTTPITLDYYTVTVNAGANVSVTGGGVYLAGSNVTLTATPARFYSVLWDGADTSANTYTIKNISAAATVEVTAAMLTYTGKVTLKLDGGKYDGATVVLKAEKTTEITTTGAQGVYSSASQLDPTKEYAIWVDGANTGAKLTNTTHEAALDYFSVTVTKDYVTISGDNTAGTYLKGSSVTLTATPESGYAFISWKSGDTVLSNNAEFTITNITAAQTLTATASDKFDAVIIVSGIPVSSITLSDGTNTKITGSTSSPYTFSNLDRTKTYTVWVNGENTGKTVSASAASAVLQYYYVALTTGNGIDSVSPAGKTYYLAGSNVTISATVKSGYTFSGWSGTNSITDASSTITGISKNYTLTAAAYVPYTGDPFNLADGQIVIEDDTANVGKIKVTQKKTTGDVITDNLDPNAPFVIIGTSDINDAISIIASRGATVQLRYVDIQVNGYERSAFNIADTAGPVRLILEGTNVLKSRSYGTALKKANSANLTIESIDGTTGHSMSTVGKVGIGNIGMNITVQNITINSGNIFATGAAAALGVSSGGNSGSLTGVTLNGGLLNMFIIGTSGDGTKLSNLTINGGTLFFKEGSNAIQSTILQSTDTSNVQFTGGSIHAEFGIPQFTPTNGSSALTMVTVATGQNSKDFSGLTISKSGDASYTYNTNDMWTDADGNLYLWLPNGTYTLTEGDFASEITVPTSTSTTLEKKTYTVNTPAAVTQYGVTFTPTVSKTSSIEKGTEITVTVTTLGTATKSGTYTLGLTGTGIGTIETQTLAVTQSTNQSGTKTFTFEMPAVNISDLALTVTFAETPRHTVTYSAPDATGGSVPATISYYEGQKYTVDNSTTKPTKTGYAFAGWDRSGQQTMGNADVTLTAKWTANTCKVTFHSNSGTETTKDQTLTYNTAANLTDNTFTRTGYTFAGWAESATGAKKYADKAEVKNLSSTQDAVIDLYALWTPNSYTVTFDENIEDGETITQSFLYNTSQELRANTFIRWGYTFSGWKDASGKTYKNGESVTITADLTLTPQWTPNEFVVKFDAGGGTGTMANQTFVSDVEQKLTKNTYTRTGYTFKEWGAGSAIYKDEMGFSDVMNSLGIVLNFIAQWTPNTYTVRFDAGGGTGTMASKQLTYDSSAALTDNGFTKTGYTFAGWDVNDTATTVVYANEASVKNLATSGEITLYAVWTADVYTLSFAANGGNGTMSDQTFATGDETAIRTNTFTKAGYHFTGWNDGKASVAANATVSAVGRTATLTAQWAANTYTVSFNANGGSTAPGDETFTYGEAKALTSYTGSRSGYKFLGWSESPAATTATYADGASVNNLTAMQGGAVTLYAVWKSDTYAVVFNSNGGEGAMADLTITNGETGKLPENHFTKTGHKFAGWNTQANGKGFYYPAGALVNFTPDVGGRVNLYAMWTLDVRYNISGTVTNGDGATLTLKQGNTVIATATANASGEYIITDIAPGVYNLVTMKDSKTITTLVTVVNKDVTANITIPADSANSSTLVVTKDEAIEEDAPAVVVGGLETVAETGTGNVKLTVTAKAEDKTSEQQSAIKDKVGGGKLEQILDITLMQGDRDIGGSNETVLEIVLPYVFAGKTDIKVWRYHGSAAEEFEALKGKPAAGFTDKTFFADTQNGLIYIYAAKFSTYAVSYQEAPPAAFYPVTASPFIDVAEGAYYYDAVLWAVDKGVTKGTSATTFSPDLTCTRAQAVTLLWRAMGSPEPVSKTCPFTDVKPDSDYYKAILWATEKGITEGTSATTFSPDLTVTRAQTVTLLWRAAGKPAQTATQPFTDVKSGAYYESAVLWAVARGITEGTSATTFTPANGCTRAQIVTFLYRYLGK